MKVLLVLDQQHGEGNPTEVKYSGIFVPQSSPHIEDASPRDCSLLFVGEMSSA